MGLLRLMNASISNTTMSPLKKCLLEKHISNKLEIKLKKVFLKGDKWFALMAPSFYPPLQTCSTWKTFLKNTTGRRKAMVLLSNYLNHTGEAKWQLCQDSWKDCPLCALYQAQMTAPVPICRHTSNYAHLWYYVAIRDIGRECAEAQVRVGPCREIWQFRSFPWLHDTALHTRTQVPGANPEEDDGTYCCPSSPRICPSWNTRALPFPTPFPWTGFLWLCSWVWFSFFFF